MKTLDDIVRKIAKQNSGCQGDESVEPIGCIGNDARENGMNGNHLQENDEIKTEAGKYYHFVNSDFDFDVIVSFLYLLKFKV